MNKLQGKLVAGLATVAFFGVLGSAQAQPAGAPPVMDTTPPSTPMMASPAPMASDSMAGQLGFGAGVTAGTSFIVPGATLNMKYWLSDVLAVMPTVALKMYKIKDIDTHWAIAPGALVLYCPWKTTSTRLSVGGGLALTFAKWGTAAGPPALGTTPTGAPVTDTYIGIALPIYAGVEHFFTKWFSMGIGVQDNFLQYGKQGDGWAMGVSIDNVNSITALGFLFFYTD